MDAHNITKRIDSLLALRGEPTLEVINQLIHGTITVMQTMYGLNSSRNRALMSTYKTRSKYFPEIRTLEKA